MKGARGGEGQDKGIWIGSKGEEGKEDIRKEETKASGC